MNVKNIFKKDNMMPVIVLSVICLVVAALMGVVNMLTEQKIADQLTAAANAAKVEVLPSADPLSFETVEFDKEKYPAALSAIYEADTGYAFETKVKGNADGLIIMVGVDKEGKVTGVKATSNAETPSFWANVSYLVSGSSSVYVGAEYEGLSAELVSGATKSSTGIYNAVKASLEAYEIYNGASIEEEPEQLPRTDADILALATGLVGVDAELVSVDFENASTVKRVYCDKGGKGYVAYVLVISESYGTVESEALVHVGTNGKIKNIKKLTWKTSDAIYGYVPPTEEAVNDFYGRLPGNGSDTIDGVELVTNATNTSTGVVNSVKEALTVIDTLIRQDMPRGEDEILSLAANMVGEGIEFTNITPDETTYLKRLYRASNGKGYVAYTVVISASYGTVESETLIYIGNDGKIKDLNKLTWKTSDAIYGYVPPTEETVNEFYGRLPGNGSDTIGGVELVTNATNTSTNVIASLSEALAATDAAIRKDLPRSEEDIISRAKQLSGADGSLTDVTPAGLEFVKRIYKLDGDAGYVVYAVVISANYGTVESETLLHVNGYGRILDVEKLTWKTSDAIYGYVPPTEEAVNAFYDRLPGNDANTVGSVELVTNATNTSTNLVNSISEGLEAVVALEGYGEATANNTARIIGIVIAALAVLAVAACICLPIVYKRRKRG